MRKIDKEGELLSVLIKSIADIDIGGMVGMRNRKRLPADAGSLHPRDFDAACYLALKTLLIIRCKRSPEQLTQVVQFSFANRTTTFNCRCYLRLGCGSRNSTPQATFAQLEILQTSVKCRVTARPRLPRIAITTPSECLQSVFVNLPTTHTLTSPALSASDEMKVHLGLHLRYLVRFV